MNKDNQKDEIRIETLREMWDTAKSKYSQIHKRMRMLDSTDSGDLWKAIDAKFPPYQVLPDTNYVAYVKNNILASLYTVVKSANIVPTSEDDKEIVTYLNLALDHVWAKSKAGFMQFQAGERAALLNIGITQVGWDENIIGNSDKELHKGNVTLKNIDPIKFMRDPYATSLETSQYCMTYDDYHKSVFLNNSNYKEKFQEYLNSQKASDTIDIPKYREEPNPAGSKEYYTSVIFWVKHNGGIYEIHTVNAEFILTSKKIEPNVFPFAILYCNLPGGKLVGSSPASQIMANNVAYNLMDSIVLTAELKNQRPPKFINSGSGLNIDQFAKHGDEADKTFVVNGDASKAVHYHEFPQPSPALPQIKGSLHMGIETVSGVDGRYTGRDTGSIITTGGTEEMLNRVTIIDTPKIVLYEEYTMQLTKLVLMNLLEFGPKRKYFVRKPNKTKYESFEVDFPKIKKDLTAFDYAINVSSELPKNKVRIAQMANMLMEKQMQYSQQGSPVQLITEEEWLMMQDLPMKEYMLERMGVQRQQDAVEEVSQVLFGYSDLVSKGANPETALMSMADGLSKRRQGVGPEAGSIPMASPEMMQ